MVEFNNLPQNIDYIVQDLECKLKNKVNSSDVSNCLFLVAASMVSYYGEKYKLCVYNSILNTNYIIDDKQDFMFTHTLRDVLSKNVYEYNTNTVISVCDIHNNRSSTNLNDFKANFTLFVTNRCVNDIDLLEGLIREINKIFLSKNQTFLIEGNNICLRNGIYKKKIANSSDTDSRKTINDVITYLQIEDMLKIMKSFEYNGPNNDLNKLLNSIKTYDMDNVVLDCCLPLVNLFRPLFDLDYIKKLLNINMYEGTIENIQEEFDSVLGNGSFDRMSKRLDKLYEDFYYGHLGGSVSEYTISKEYVAIRDNFINKYIKKKYA